MDNLQKGYADNRYIIMYNVNNTIKTFDNHTNYTN